jgi:phosphoribosylglycinamide formyltransferase-1
MLKIAVFISGGGTTLGNLIEKSKQGELAVEIVLVLSSKANVRGLEIANAAGIPTAVIKKRVFGTDLSAYSMAMFEPCRQAGVELVVMGGFLQHVLIPADFQNRVINIHPSLIPSFCGQSMYGENVHRAVLDYGVKVSG